MQIRTSKGVLRTIFNIEELSPKDKYYAVVFVTQLINISNKEFKEDEKWHGYINRARQYFRNLRGGINEAKFLEILERNKIIKINHSYEIGKFSKSFKVLINHADTYCTLKAEMVMNRQELINHIKRIRKRDERLDADLAKHKQNIIDIIDLNLEKVKDLYHRRGIELMALDKEQLEKELESVKVDELDRPMQVLIYKTLELLDVESSKISKGKNSNRHYHILSNASRELRECLMSKLEDKKHLAELDVKNSQPLLLLALIKAKKIKIEESVSKLTQEGKYYEMLAAIFGLDYKRVAEDKKYRTDFKRVVYRDILFAKYRHNKNFMKLKKACPLYAEAIIQLDKDGLLNRQLQQLEAKIMLPLTLKHGGIGIHDSVMLACTQNLAELEVLRKDIIDIFKEYDLEVILESHKIA